MPTRFYFPNPVTRPRVAATVSGGWNLIGNATTGRMTTVKGNSLMSSGTSIVGGTANGSKFLDRQYVSDALWGDQVISGNCSGQLQVKESAANDNVNQIIFCSTVIAPNGTRRGTLYNTGSYSTTAEFLDTGPIRNKIILDGDTMFTVNALDGDRIEVQIGYSCSAGGTTVAAQGLWGTAAPDAESGDETTVAQRSPWLQFNNINLRFKKTFNMEINDEGGM